MLLNTDWTERGASRRVSVMTPGVRFDTAVREREILLITVLPFGALVQGSATPHVEVLESEPDRARLRVHAAERQGFTLHSSARNIAVTADGKPVQVTAKGDGSKTFQLDWGMRTQGECLISCRSAR